MEGFLFKKARGESTGFLSRRNWSKRWCVLEGSYLTYYENFNNDKGEPMKKKGVVPMGGCNLKLATHRERPNCFVIRHADRRPVYMNAASENEKFVWLEALEKASNLKEGDAVGAKLDLTEYWKVLNIDPTTNPDIKSIDRSYKRAALKAHPDKGGDSFVFKAVTDAYEIIMSSIREEEEEKKHTQEVVVATIKKGPSGVGFGMVVIEDAKKGHILVKEVLGGMVTVGETIPPNDKVKKGDVIIGIDKDNIKGWPMTRVVARLNNFRVPIGSTVTLKFSRQVRIDGEEEREDKPDFTEEENPWEQEVAPFVMPSHDDQPVHYKEHGRAPVVDDPYPDMNALDGDSDDEEEVEAEARESHSHHQHHSQSHHHSHRRGSTASVRRTSVILDMAHGDAALLASRIEKLTLDKSDLQAELDDLREKYALSQANLGSLKREVQTAEESAAEQMLRAEHAEVEFQRLLLSSEEYNEARKANGIENEQERENRMRSPPARSPITSRTLKEARQRAIASVAASDPSGNLLRQWERNGESAEDKLKRLEMRLMAKGLLNVEPITKDVINRRRASLERGLNPGNRVSRDQLEKKNVIHVDSNGRRSQESNQMKRALNQRLKYRPNSSDLVKGGILRPKAGSRNV